VSKYLVALESENPPINPKQKPKAISPSDPCAAWTTRGRHKVMFGYSLNFLIDMERSQIEIRLSISCRTSSASKFMPRLLSRMD
jgi:hypothetical protein